MHTTSFLGPLTLFGIDIPPNFLDPIFISPSIFLFNGNAKLPKNQPRIWLEIKTNYNILF